MSETLATITVSPALAERGMWQSLDHKIGVCFFIVVGVGGIVCPLGLMVYSWFV